MMPAELLVIGIDAATWTVIDEHLDDLPNFKRLKDDGNARTLTLDQKPWSASCWASMFSGATTEEHGHTDFVEDGEVQTRSHIDVEFVWDRLDEQGYDVKALNVPFVVPPYNYNLEFVPPAHGAPTELDEMEEEIRQVTEKAVETLANEDLDLFITCYVSLDKLQHFHWGEDVVPAYYKKVDAAIGRYMDQCEKLIVVSDHGFCDREEAAVRTLPDETPKGEIKGEHSKEAILITRNIDREIGTIRDVADVIEAEVTGESLSDGTVPAPETAEDREKIMEQPLDEKIWIAENTVRAALERYDPGKTVIGFTGGKDSTAVAYIVKKVCEEQDLVKPTFMFVDHGQHFDEIEAFVSRISREWGFNVVTARNDDLIGQADAPGDEVPVDALNERNRREVARLSQDYEAVPWLMNTEAGNHLLKTVPMNELIEARNITAVINGVRWDEQEARSDETFFSPRDAPEHMRVHPILPFTEQDIWRFTWDVIVPNAVEGWDRETWPGSQDDLPAGIGVDDLPVSPKYWEGFRSLGSEVSTDRTDDDPAWMQDLENTTEREGRAQDKEGIMEKLRDLGYM